MGLIDRLIAYRELGLRLAPCNGTGEPDKLNKSTASPESLKQTARQI